MIQREVTDRCQTIKQCIFHHYSLIHLSVIDPIVKFAEQENEIALPESRLDPGFVTEKLINQRN